MKSRHLIDPEIAPLLEALLPIEFQDELLPQIRARVAEMAVPQPLPEGVGRTEHLVAGGPDGNRVRVLVYKPTGRIRTRSALLHMHGGGYVLGTPELNEQRNANIVSELGCVLVSVDYRLAPETVAPGNVQDCYAALRWMHDQSAALGVDPARIGVIGESAGGGLAAALAILARDRQEMPLAFQALIYPMLDDRTGVHGDVGHFGEFIWTASNNGYGWSRLLGRQAGSDTVPPYGVPARVESVAGLPPVFLAVGALDLLMGEGLDYARRLAHAGVPTEAHVYPGAFHAFDMAAASRVGRQFDADLKRALSRFIGGEG